METFARFRRRRGLACLAWLPLWRAAMGAPHKDLPRVSGGGMVVDACVGGWNGEVLVRSNSSRQAAARGPARPAPFGARRGDACRRLRKRAGHAGVQVQRAPCTALLQLPPDPRLRPARQPANVRGCLVSSPRVPGQDYSCVPGPVGGHAMRRGDLGSYNGRVPPGFSRSLSPVALSIPRMDMGHDVPGLALSYARRFAAPLATCGCGARATEKATRGPDHGTSIVAGF